MSSKLQLDGRYHKLVVAPSTYRPCCMCAAMVPNDPESPGKSEELYWWSAKNSMYFQIV